MITSDVLSKELSRESGISERADETAWQNYLSKKEHLTFVDDTRWDQFVRRHYQLRQFRAVSYSQRKIDGGISLTMANHPVFGKYLVTAPFASFGGFSFDNSESMSRLINFTEQMVEDENAKYAVIRHMDNTQNVPSGWTANNIYATYIVDLDSDPDEIFRNSIKKNARRDVNKAIREGLTIQFGAEELLNPFWDVITRSMQELGSPYHSRMYLKNLLDIWGDDALLGIVYTKDNVPAGCCLLMCCDDKANLLHANLLSEFRSMCTGDFLYWSAIEECCKRGYSQLDLGRSLIGSGNENFKMKWKPSVHPLHYWYYLKDGDTVPNLNQSNPKYKLPRLIWSKLPLSVQRRLGPYLISGIL
jgi:serine/alanine adding enzyme